MEHNDLHVRWLNSCLSGVLIVPLNLQWDYPFLISFTQIFRQQKYHFLGSRSTASHRTRKHTKVIQMQIQTPLKLSHYITGAHVQCIHPQKNVFKYSLTLVHIKDKITHKMLKISMITTERSVYVVYSALHTHRIQLAQNKSQQNYNFVCLLIQMAN